MEQEGGGGVRRRLSLFEQMSAVDHTRDLAGLTLEAVLGFQKHPPASVSHTPSTEAAPVNRTLLDIIRDEEPRGGGGGDLFGNKDKKTWKGFREKLRLNRAGAACTSTVNTPASDVPIQSNDDLNSNNFDHPSRSLIFRGGSVGFTTVNSGDSTHSDESNDHSAVSSSKPQMTRQNNTQQSDSSRSENSSFNNTIAAGDETPARSFRPQMSRHSLSRHIGIPVVERETESPPAYGGRRLLSAVLAEERSLSAREAVAAQEAAAAAAAVDQQPPEEANFTANGGAVEAEEPVRMSLMDLLEETDQHMGLVGSTYTMADEVECDDRTEGKDVKLDGGDGIEHTCCVCMVRHKGAAFIPCGHTFCRLCSREVWVQRGNCPLCNGNILEILDIF